MKGKIFVGLLLGGIGGIYAFLIYPLLQNAPDVTLNEERSIGNSIVIPGKDPESIGAKGDNSYTSPLPIVSESSKGQKNNTICFQSTCFAIEIADTPALRAQGLMNRPSLQQDAGMLFVFDTPGSYGFWMKNTLIPLDIIWLDENLIVVDTATMTPCTADPCSTYNHQGLALYALEINAGLVEQYGIGIGMQFMRK